MHKDGLGRSLNARRYKPETCAHIRRDGYGVKSGLNCAEGNAEPVRLLRFGAQCLGYCGARDPSQNQDVSGLVGPDEDNLGHKQTLSGKAA